MPPPPPPPPIRVSPDWGSLNEPDVPPSPSAVQKPAASASPTSGTLRFFPAFRPPIAKLIVCDDGERDGEVIRLRADRFIIGRTQGDLLIPHDEMISSRHLEIARQHINGNICWVIADLQSRNGLFVRVSRTVLKDGDEFLIGRGRYRFEAPEHMVTESHDEIPMPEERGMTIGWGAGPTRPLYPSLAEVTTAGIGARALLTAAEYWIGSALGCAISRPDDHLVDARHARLIRGSDGRWEVVNNQSLNGIWYRVPHLIVEGSRAFQIGEQRFRLEVSQSS